MHTSFCTIGFQKNKWGKDKRLETPLAAILQVLAEAGYDGVEIWADHWMLATPPEQEAILAQLADLTLRVAMISSYYDFTTSDESAGQSMTNARRILDAARRLGSRGIRLFTGKTASRDATPAQWSRCARCLQQLCDESAADGILWCLETHSWNLMDTIEGSLRILREVGRPNIKLIFQPSTFGGDYMAALDALAMHAAHVHATNHKGKERALLADGEIDYRAVIGGLRRFGFDGFISVEWFGDDPAGVARKESPYLRELIGSSSADRR
jgi:sugar phosphate isomerase/epimerase